MGVIVCVIVCDLTWSVLGNSPGITAAGSRRWGSPKSRDVWAKERSGDEKWRGTERRELLPKREDRRRQQRSPGA